MFVLMKLRTSLKMGNVRSKTRSLGQISEKKQKKKPCVRFTGHIFSSVIMKLGQNVCLNEILNNLESGVK